MELLALIKLSHKKYKPRFHVGFAFWYGLDLENCGFAIGVVKCRKGDDIMYLPGTINERIGDLRTGKGLSQKELCKLIDIAPSQLSRIENGETKAISSDILIKLSKGFGVSTDYILGLTTISAQKSYDISELGLSEDAVKALIVGGVDVQILNRIIAHKQFPYLMVMIKRYFDDSTAAGIMGRNEMIDFMTSTIADYAKENPDKRAEIRHDILNMKSEKLGAYEADFEKIKSVFLAILKDIKRILAKTKTLPR